MMRQALIAVLLLTCLTSNAHAGLNLGAGPSYPLMLSIDPQLAITYPHLFSLGGGLTVGTQTNGAFQAISLEFERSLVTSTDRVSLGPSGSWFIFYSEVNFIYEKRIERRLYGARLRAGLTDLAYSHTTKSGFFLGWRAFLGLSVLGSQEGPSGLVEVGVSFPFGWRRRIKER